MRFEDKLFRVAIVTEQDDNLNAVQKTVEEYVGNCVVTTNKRSQQCVGEDGKSYTYSLQVTVHRPHIRPKVGESVRIVTRDGSLDTTLAIVAVQPVKQYLQIWL
jgi:hypothetical protein